MYFYVHVSAATNCLFPPDSNLYTEEERVIHDHIKHLLTAFASATVVVIVESNADHRWPARLCQINTAAFGSRVKFVCSWKEPTQQQIGVHTGRSEKFSAAYYTNELIEMGWSCTGTAFSRVDSPSPV